MAKQNKVAVNLAQDFTDAEKAQARANIGAAASGAGGANIAYISNTASVTVDQTLAANHTYTLSIPIASQYRMNGTVNLYMEMYRISESTGTINQDSIAVKLRVSQIRSNQGFSTQLYTANFCRLNNGDTHELGIASVNSIDTGIVEIRVKFDWPADAIQENVKLEFNVSGSIIG